MIHPAKRQPSAKTMTVTVPRLDIYCTGGGGDGGIGGQGGPGVGYSL